MLFLLLKVAHVLGAMLFLGTGLGSAYYKLRAWRSSDPAVVAWCDAEIVLADWIFTVPAGLLMPSTGLWLAHLYGLSWRTPWVFQGLLGYSVAGLCWLPAAWLQLRMRALATQARDSRQSLPERYHALQRAWALLGVPSFGATLLTLWLMVSKQAW